MKTSFRKYKLFLLVPMIFMCYGVKAQKTTDRKTMDIETELCKKGIELDSCNYVPLYDELCKWLYTPYKYAGNSTKGIDCSGLVKIIYDNVFSLTLLGGSKNIYEQVLKVTQKEDLSEGDLVFFKIKKNQISHIGMYLKDGYFVHASRRNGVIISNLNENYYQKYYFSGGRTP